MRLLLWQTYQNHAMKRYVVILTENNGERSIVGEHDTIEEAKAHLSSISFYPQYRRSKEFLELSEDGMSGSGSDEDGEFNYHIVERLPGKFHYSLVMYRNGLPREFVWKNGHMLDCGTGKITPMSWEGWQMLPYDLKQQGFKFHVD